MVNTKADVLKKLVVPIENLQNTVFALHQEFQLRLIVVGDRTCSRIIREMLAPLKLKVETVDEDKSSMEGRYRYLAENTKGLARIIPIGLRTPKQPFDDYVAVVIAERYLKNNPNII